MDTNRSLPTCSIARYPRRKRLATMPHYLLAAYESTESFTQRIIVVDPDVEEPTMLLRPGTRTTKRSNVLATVVPTLDSIDAAVATTITRIASTYWGLRAWPSERRRAGVVDAHGLQVVRQIRAPR